MDRILGAIIFLFLGVSFQSFEIARSTEPTEIKAGGLTPVIPSEEERNDFICGVEREYNEYYIVDSEYVFKLIPAGNFTAVQLVNGIEYRMSVLFEETECKRSDLKYLDCEVIDACPPKKQWHLVKCDSSLTYHPGMFPDRYVKIYNCVPFLFA